MKTPALATVYLDNEPVGLMGDPRPSVSKILAAGGKRPEAVEVFRVPTANALRGKPVRLEEVLDRTSEPAKPIYLTSKSKPRPASATMELPSVEGGQPLPLGTELPQDEDRRGPSRPAQVAARRTPPPADREPEWDP